MSETSCALAAGLAPPTHRLVIVLMAESDFPV